MDGRVAVGGSAGLVRDGANSPGGLAPGEGTVRTAPAPLFAPASKLSSDVGAGVPDVTEQERS